MLSMINSSQSLGTDAGSNANPRTTNVSATANNGTSVAHAIASLAFSESTVSQEFSQVTQQYAKQPLHDAEDVTRHHQHISSAADKAAAVLTLVSRINLPAKAVKASKKRSTKSKCSPGLRSGKWTVEEEAFTNLIIHYFKRGLLDVEDGTSLRWYLAKRLNCEAMRVTKKLKGNSSIGKQIFRSIENTIANRQAIQRAREDLCRAEAQFIESLSGKGVGSATPSSPLPTSLAISVRGRRILPNLKYSEDQLSLAPMPQPKSEDARLLMHFFCEASDTGCDEEPEDEQKVAAGSPNIDLRGKLGKKRPLSSVINVDTSKKDTLLV